MQTPGLPEPGDVDAALDLARELGRSAPRPGSGTTRELWHLLEDIAAHDLGTARVVEPHLDAIAILEQAGRDPVSEAGQTWGVFAAEGGTDPLTARRTPTGWRLDGTKPWCSLAARLDRALVTAHVGGERGLFSVALADTGVSPSDTEWPARGLSEIPSGPVTFDGVHAEMIGAEQWYLRRPGFAWGGIGVAACWYGGAVALGRRLHAAPAESEFAQMHLGAVDAVLQDARRALDEGARSIDDGSAIGAAGSLLAKRIRMTVASAVETVLLRVGHALGPGPLATEPEHAKGVADLQLYVRQHHAERDQASLGRSIAGGPAPW
ncbi:acyl-CoA/acyl-ACP dehydrogenase [Microbacteriaceae bacterium VKM Ac-2855]|nr:acyl-CoA/acyl-ACP dehydrogenase [Microbacteriaceae bacterium VKM Ac-2855]